MKRKRKPSHPGEAFKTLVLDELKHTTIYAANCMGVSHKELKPVIDGDEPLSIEMAEKWGIFTNTSTDSWYNMQVALDEWEIENA